MAMNVNLTSAANTFFLIYLKHALRYMDGQSGHWRRSVTNQYVLPASDLKAAHGHRNRSYRFSQVHGLCQEGVTGSSLGALPQVSVATLFIPN